MEAPQRIGIFGGTFDPPHIGHVAVGEEVLETLRLERLLFVPTSRSPLKAEAPVASGALRIRMLEAAVSGDGRFEVLDIEIRRGGTSYTVDTLAELASERPDARLVLVIGVDQWADMGSWSRPREVTDLAEIAVVTRSGERPAEVDPGLRDGPPPPFTEVSVTRIDISSTLVRERIGQGRSARYLVPEAVHRIIEAEKLYL